MKSITLGINGFGRIGRTLFRLLREEPHIHVGAINDVADINTLAHLLKYDSIHGIFPDAVSVEENTLITPKGTTRVSHEEHPDSIPWAEAGVDLVIEATGRFKTRESLRGHLKAGAPKVMLTAPPPEEDIPMVVYGINHETLGNQDLIFSNASCTTHNAAPMIEILDKLCGIQQAYITTVHSYTSDQSLHDQATSGFKKGPCSRTIYSPYHYRGGQSTYPNLPASVFGHRGMWHTGPRSKWLPYRHYGERP